MPVSPHFRLAYYVPATAFSINMHIYWVGVPADFWRTGDNSLKWMLKEAVDGEIFAVGHAERGNDLPMLSTNTAKAASFRSSRRCRMLPQMLPFIWPAVTSGQIGSSESI